MGLLGDIGGLVSAGAGIYEAFAGDDGKSRDLLQEQEKNLEFSRALARALADPRDPRFQRLLEQERAAARSAFAEGIDRLLIEDARARARGAPGIMMSDRRDEAIASAVGRQRELGEKEARDASRAALQQAAGAAGFGLSAGIPSIQVAQQVEQAGKERRGGGFDLIAETLGALDKGDFTGAFRGKKGADPIAATSPTGSAVRIS